MEKQWLCKNSLTYFALDMIMIFFLLCYFAICQKYLWIVEMPCLYFKVISKEGCYLLLIGISCFHFWIKSLIFSAMKWTKTWQFNNNEVANYLTIPKFKIKSAFHYNMVRAVYIYYSKGSISILFEAKCDNFQNSF